MDAKTKQHLDEFLALVERSFDSENMYLAFARDYEAILPIEKDRQRLQDAFTGGFLAGLSTGIRLPDVEAHSLGEAVLTDITVKVLARRRTE